MNTRHAIAAESPVKRRAILEQAIRTFAELGFRGTDVQVIADRAGVGKGTVYRYFGNKEDLFWATTFAVLERLERHMLAAIQGVDRPTAKLRAASLAYAAFFEANPQYLEIFVQERAEFRGSAPEAHVEYHEKLIAQFGKIVEQGTAGGEIRPVDVRKTIVALANVLHGTVVNNCFSSVGHSMTEMAEFAVDTFLEGIRAHISRDNKGDLQ